MHNAQIIPPCNCQLSRVGFARRQIAGVLLREPRRQDFDLSGSAEREGVATARVNWRRSEIAD